MHTKSTAKINESSNLARGTPRWLAPELFPMSEESVSATQLHNTKATDIYAFAMVGYEVIATIY